MSSNACDCRERYNLTKKYVISQEGVFLNKNIPS